MVSMDIGDRVPSDLILNLNSEAKERALRGEKVINGTIGMMHLDDGKLPLSALIRSTIARHTEDSDFEYSSVPGEALYREGLLEWFFPDVFEKEKEEGRVKTIATPGGTGAITLALKEFASLSSPAVLLPKLGWPNYPSQVSSFLGEPCYYDNYDEEGHFSFPQLKERLDSLFREGKENVLLVLNDPCQNPTGYCLSSEEWENMVSLLSSYRGKVRLLLDIAYFDFASEESKAAIASSLVALCKAVPVYVAMSFSKTFSFYGLRIGALSILAPTSKQAEEIFDGFKKGARALWSTSNHMAMNAIADLLSHGNTREELKREVALNRDIVHKRASLFLEEAKECGLKVYPYRFGFFCSLPCEDAVVLCQRLKEKEIYLAPVSTKVLRLAFCCLPTDQIKGLAKRIREAEEKDS
ncbi:MAG: aminotransferase class I/II-fold pyridoxal phosphate-dependent enzyme [Eubacteriales bacterium]|nr:aminotransferase class I/II-fold pyridoxal phosphate-dependent enzyme [Eubacteriales bacterium]